MSGFNLILGLNLLYNAVKYPAIRGLSVSTKVKALVGGTEREIYRRSIRNNKSNKDPLLRNFTK